MPINSTNTLHNHIHVAVRLRHSSELELSKLRDKRGQWVMTDDMTI